MDYIILIGLLGSVASIMGLIFAITNNKSGYSASIKTSLILIGLILIGICIYLSIKEDKDEPGDTEADTEHRIYNFNFDTEKSEFRNFIQANDKEIVKFKLEVPIYGDNLGVNDYFVSSTVTDLSFLMIYNPKWSIGLKIR